MCSRLITSCLALAALTAAQVTSKCNPLTANNCPANPGLSAASYTADFTKGAQSDWTAFDTPSYSDQGAALSVGFAGQAPTLYSNFYVLFGRIEATIKAAPGQGIVSSLVLLSDALDEVDWEWLGGEPSTVQTNYFGKGNTSTYDRVQNVPVDAATSVFHTYTIDWTPTSITWLINGKTLRTLNYADANGGKNFPQTPCRIGLGPWAGGASESEGTREWAGGPTDFTQGPFVMYAQNVHIVNYNPAKSYQYGDQSGNYQSIKIIGGTSSSVTGSGASSDPNSESGSTTASTSASKISTAVVTSSTSSSSNSTKTSSSSSSSETTLRSVPTAGTSSVANAVSPSTAPSNAAVSTYSMTWVPGTVISMLAFAFGMTMM